MSNRQSLMFPDIYADVLDKKRDYNRIIIDPQISAHMRETELALACTPPPSLSQSLRPRSPDNHCKVS